MTDYFRVGLGGALGAAFRHWLVLRIPAQGFPWGTFAVNVIGAFLIGMAVFGWGSRYGTHESDLFLRVGLCGGFTTFSSFSLDVIALLNKGEWLSASVYAVGWVFCCVTTLMLTRLLMEG